MSKPRMALPLILAFIVALIPLNASAQQRNPVNTEAVLSSPLADDAVAASPLDGARLPGADPLVLRWTHPDASINRWEVQVSGDRRFDADPATASMLLQSAVVGERAWQMPGLQPCRPYFWRVRPAGAEGQPPAPWSPTWSFTTSGTTPVVNKIAFIYHYQGEPRGDFPPSYDELTVMNSDGSGRTGLTIDTPYFPAWSADGCLAFNGPQGLMVMNADGSSRISLTEKNWGIYRPAWSPDGKKIAFVADMGDGAADIYLVNTDGTGLTRLTTGSGKEYVTWSPDGKKIAFNWAEPGAGYASIYVMNADGSGVTNRSNVSVTTGNDTEPAWSPDGKKIAFTAFRTGSNQIHVMNIDGSGVTALPDAFGDQPDWSADGAKIMFHTDRGGQHQGAIWIMNADGSGQQQLSALASLEASGQEEGELWPAWSRSNTATPPAPIATPPAPTATPSAAPTATPPAPTATPPAPTATPPATTIACSWAGTWSTNLGDTPFGDYVLAQTGNIVNGSGNGNNVRGTVAGNQLSGTLAAQNAAFDFLLTMAADCNFFTGATQDGAEWSGQRVP